MISLSSGISVLAEPWSYQVSPEQVNAYFTPLDYAMYLAMILVGLVVFYQWRWATICRENVQLLVVKADGHGDYLLASQSGGSVTLKNPKTGGTKLWPINKLSAIDVPYPSNGFVPRAFQKQIRQVVVDEEDWEPLLNRGPYGHNVASPDVRERLLGLGGAVQDTAVREAILEYVGGLNSAPTREMVASPELLGNLLHEEVTKALVSANKDVQEMLDAMTGMAKRLGKQLTPTMFFVGIGIVILALGFAAFQIVPALSGMEEMQDNLLRIMQSSGITPVAPVPVK